MPHSFKLTLRKLNINFKIICLFINAFLLFPYITHEEHLSYYAGFLLIWTIFLGIIYYKLSSVNALKMLIKLWFLGLFFYVCFALIFYFFNLNLSPLLIIKNQLNRLIYLAIYPIRILAVFFMGMSFIEIISPIEFLKYGKIGFQLSYLLRSFQVSMQQIAQNKKALEMMGEIPNDLKSLKDFVILIKKAPLILSLTIRNLMLWLFWSSHNFEKFKINYQKTKNKNK